MNRRPHKPGPISLVTREHHDSDEPPLAVYDGLRMLGEVATQDGTFTVVLPNGALLGTYPTRRDAIAAAKEARPANG